MIMEGRWAIPRDYFIFNPLNLFNGRAVCPYGAGTFKAAFDGSGFNFLEFDVLEFHTVSPLRGDNGKVKGAIDINESFDRDEIIFLKGCLQDTVENDSELIEFTL